MKINKDNLLENLDKLGPWSVYGLAEEALKHYFPDRLDDDSTVHEIADCLPLLNCENWHDVIIKYHKEVGYNHYGEHFDDGLVNEH